MIIRPVLSVMAVLILTAPAMAVSIGEMARDCGEDSKVYCQGVGYGEAMQQCLDSHFDALTPACKAIIERLNGGERVSLF